MALFPGFGDPAVRVWRLRGCPAASLTSGILGISDACGPSGTPCLWLRGYREVFQLLAVEHFLSSVSGGGVCVFPPVRLSPRSWKIRMSACFQAVCPLNRVACFSVRRLWAAVRLPGSLAKYRQQLSGYPAVSLSHGLVMWLSGAAWVPGAPSPPQGVCPCDCAETEQRPCSSGGGLFGSWVPGECPAMDKPSSFSANRRAAWRLGFPAVCPSG